MTSGMYSFFFYLSLNPLVSRILTKKNSPLIKVHPENNMNTPGGCKGLSIKYSVVRDMARAEPFKARKENPRPVSTAISEA